MQRSGPTRALFVQLKKLRSDINIEMKNLVGKDMVSETWL